MDIGPAGSGKAFGVNPQCIHVRCDGAMFSVGVVNLDFADWFRRLPEKTYVCSILESKNETTSGIYLLDVSIPSTDQV